MIKNLFIEIKILLFLMIVSLIFLCISCKKAPYDYCIIWYGSYECKKNVNNYDTTTVIVDILPTEIDSTVHIRERTIYDLNMSSQLEVKTNAKIDKNGSFDGACRIISLNKYCYFRGSFYKDSLHLKMYLAYDTKPSVSEDSITGEIIKYTGLRMENSK